MITMKKSIIYILLFALGACRSNSIEVPQIKAVDLSDLKVGQRSTYMRYSSNCEDTEVFEFTGDTLILEVDKNDDGYMFREYLTASSPLFIDGQFTE